MGDGNSLNVEQEPFNIEAVAKQLTPAGPTLLTSFLSVFKKSNRKQSNAAEAAEHVKVGAGLPSASKPLPILRKRVGYYRPLPRSRRISPVYRRSPPKIPRLPDDIIPHIARNARPLEAAKLRRLSGQHAYLVTKKDLSYSAASLLWCERNHTAVVHLWSRVYKRFPGLSSRPDCAAMVLEGLLMLGADVRVGGFAALIAASDHGHEMPVRILVKAGVNLHAWSDMALCRAAKLGHYEVCKALIEAGARVNEQDGRPLCSAAEHGHDNVCKLLIAAGADLKALGMRHDGALCAAAKNGRVAVMRTLLEAGANTFAKDDLAKTIRTAAGSGQEAVVRMLIDYGVDVRAHEDAALFSAAANGHDQVVRLLVEHGAGHLNEALQGAEHWGRERVIQTLLAAGAQRRRNGPVWVPQALSDDSDVGEDMASVTEDSETDSGEE